MIKSSVKTYINLIDFVSIAFYVISHKTYKFLFVRTYEKMLFVYFNKCENYE